MKVPFKNFTNDHFTAVMYGNILILVYRVPKCCVRTLISLKMIFSKFKIIQNEIVTWPKPDLMYFLKTIKKKKWL